MTLFIACLMIYQFDMNPWLYAVAVVIWGIGVIIRSVIVFALGER